MLNNDWLSIFISFFINLVPLSSFLFNELLTLLFLKNNSSVFILSKLELKLFVNNPPNKLFDLLFKSFFCSLSLFIFSLFGNNFCVKRDPSPCILLSNKFCTKIVSFFSLDFSFLSSFLFSFPFPFLSFFSIFSSFAIILLVTSLFLSGISSSFISPGSISISSGLLICSICSLFGFFSLFTNPNLISLEFNKKLFFSGELYIFSLLLLVLEKPNFILAVSVKYWFLFSFSFFVPIEI